MTEFSPFPKAAPDFTDPLGLLRACHGRIFSHCDTLERLVPHLQAKGADSEAAEAMSRIHRYFSTSAQHHHEDEEIDLFPRLRGHSAEVDTLVAELEHEHRDLAMRWHALAGWLHDAPRAAAETGAFAKIVGDFVDSYRRHGSKENDGVLLLAAKLLKRDDLQNIGIAMARRRGVN